MKDAIKSLKRAMIRAACKRFGYRMLIQFGEFDGCTHYSWTAQGALEWAGMYPAECPKHIFNRRGEQVAWSYQYPCARVK